MSKKLVVYYSLSGHTKEVAETIASHLDADILRIELKRNYNMATALTVGRVHIGNKHMPKLKPININVEDYDEIILGSPVWWYTFAPPIRSFVNEFDLSDKKFRLFSTHQGANGSTFKDLSKLMGNGHVLSTKDYCYSGSFDYQKIQGDFKH